MSRRLFLIVLPLERTRSEMFLLIYLFILTTEIASENVPNLSCTLAPKIFYTLTMIYDNDIAHF